MGGKKAPDYAKTTTDTGLFGKATTSGKSSTFTPTEFQKQLIGITEQYAPSALESYLNPNYESPEYKQADDYYTNKMNTLLQNQYLNPALSRNLLRGSTASDAMRGFAQDLANTEYERQQDYRNQLLQNYQAAMLPYATIYDISKGTQGLSNQLSQNVSNYNLAKYQAEQAANAGLYNMIGKGIGAAGTIGGALLSDRRLKENLKLLDTVDDINIYKFDYIDGAKDQVGVIAQEVAYLPDVVSVADNGYMQVDYSKLPKEVQERIEDIRNA